MHGQKKSNNVFYLYVRKKTTLPQYKVYNKEITMRQNKGRPIFQNFTRKYLYFDERRTRRRNITPDATVSIDQIIDKGVRYRYTY